jgi:hypothetical protein
MKAFRGAATSADHANRKSHGRASCYGLFFDTDFEYPCSSVYYRLLLDVRSGDPRDILHASNQEELLDLPTEYGACGYRLSETRLGLIAAALTVLVYHHIVESLHLTSFGSARSSL